MTDELPPEWQQAKQVQDKYQDMLLAMPHVIGVGLGFAEVEGDPTGEIALVVMVDHKLPQTGLSAREILPARLDGVRVDVQEFPEFDAQ